MERKQQSPHFPDSFYRVSVKGLLVREGKLLLVQDFTGKQKDGGSPVWELPGGGLEFGESPQETLRREVKEEMGITVTLVAAQPAYLWPSRKIENARRVDWFYVLVSAYRFEVENLDFTPSEECRAIRFVSQEELKALPDLAVQLQPLRDLFDPKDFA